MDELFDRDLGRLFDQTHEPLQTADFSLAVERSIQRVRRHRRIWRVVLLVDAVVVALILAPDAMDVSVMMADSLSIAIARFGTALVSPLGMGCSLAFGAWFLRRIRRMAA